MKNCSWVLLRFFVLCLAPIFLFAEWGFPQEDITQYPSRPITFIMPSVAGSESDLACRLISKEAEKFLGRPIVVVNKPGGSFTVGLAAVASSKPDGYTVGYTAHSGLFLVPYMDKVPYHPVKDITQIMQFGYVNLAVVVKSDSPFKKFEDIVTYARKNPKKATYGSTGVGTIGALAMEEIAKREGVEFTHIPFKGSPETQTALLGGHVLFGAGSLSYSLLESGQIRLLLLIAENRSPGFPNTPILKDLGYEIPAPLFINVAGPKGIPDEIVRKLEGAYTKAMGEPAFIKGMKELHVTVIHRNSKELSDYVSYNYEVYGKLLKEMGLSK